jgi:anti-sigma B factor antagonist
VSFAELNLDRDRTIVHARIRGDIDMSNAAELRRELSSATPNEALALILDLTEVDYLDSAGLHLIHHLREDLRAGGQKLALVIPRRSPIHATLRLAGLDWRDDITETADAARRAINPPSQSESANSPAGGPKG